MDLQEVFDKAATHLLTQKVRSTLKNGEHPAICAYRGDNGLTCPIGCLLLDEDYNPAMEGTGLPAMYVYARKGSCLLAAALEKSVGYEGNSVQRSFLGSFQSVHDGVLPENWIHELYNIARLHHLSAACLNVFKQTKEKQCRLNRK